MARPQSPDYDKRRHAIVEAAGHLFARQGFQGASIAELAKGCGTSKALIYHYFSSKEDILYEVMAAHLDALVDAADDAMQVGSASERLRALTQSFMQLYVGAQDSQKVLLNELDNLPRERRAEVVGKQQRIRAVVETLVRQIRPDANLAALPLTMLFFGMINWSHTWFRPGGEISPEEFARLAADLMLNGLTRIQAS